MNVRSWLICWLLALCCSGPLLAAETIPVQGMLTDAQGAPLTASVEITFSLYNLDQGGDLLWTDTLAVEVDNGIFSVYLGQSAALDLALFKDNQDLWLGIQVGEDQEMARVYLGNVPFAAYARHTDSEPAPPSIPAGFCMFSFSQADCPPGWTKNTADIDRTLMITADNPGQTGGSATHAHAAGSLSAQSHTHTTGNHALTVAQMPAHTHQYIGTDEDYWNGNFADTSGALKPATFNTATTSTGSGQAHNHGATGAAGDGNLSGSTAEAASLPPHVQVTICCKS